MPSLSIYDRTDIDAPTLIRTVTRKPGTGQPMLKPVTRPAKAKPRPRPDNPDDARQATARKTLLLLMPELRASKPGPKRERLKAEVLRLGKIAGLKPKRRDPGHAARVRAIAHGGMVESADRGW